MAKARGTGVRCALAIGVLAALVCAACAQGRDQEGTISGQLLWFDFQDESIMDHEVALAQAAPLGQVRGTVYLALESDYDKTNYAGPPAPVPPLGFERHGKHFGSMPLEWQQAGQRPHGREPAYLRQAPLDNSGQFRFENVPPGTHTLFIIWGHNPDPADCATGPIEVIVSDSESTDLRIPVSMWDMRST